MKHRLAEISRVPSDCIPEELCTAEFGAMWEFWLWLRLDVHGEWPAEISVTAQLQFLKTHPDPVACVENSARPIPYKGIFPAARTDGHYIKKGFAVRTGRHLRATNPVVDTVRNYVFVPY